MKFNVPNLPIQNRLVRHLVWVGIAKIFLLYVIWFAFFRDRTVHVDPQSAAQQILYTPSKNIETSEVNQQ